MQCEMARATVSAGLPVVLAGVDLARGGELETSPVRSWLRCRRRRSRCRRRIAGWLCLCKSARPNSAQLKPSSRRARRETSPLASERPGGPVLPLGAASCGLAVNSLHSPCAPLLPVWGVDRARHTVPPPPGRLALPSPPHRHPLHARASGPAAAACRGPPDHRLAAPFPLPKPIPLPFPMWHKGLSFPSRPPPFFLSPPWPLQKGGDLRCEAHACGGAPPCVPMVTSSSCYQQSCCCRCCRC